MMGLELRGCDGGLGFVGCVSAVGVRQAFYGGEAKLGWAWKG
jgi:hypothetical protein